MFKNAALPNHNYAPTTTADVPTHALCLMALQSVVVDLAMNSPLMEVRVISSIPVPLTTATPRQQDTCFKFEIEHTNISSVVCDGCVLL